MSLIQEFKAFVAKGNVVDLAVAVVVGSAFGEIVKTFVNAVVMPLVSYVLPAKMAWEEWTLGKIRIGLVLGALTLWRKSVWPAVVVHLTIDGVGLVAIKLIAPFLHELTRSQIAP